MHPPSVPLVPEAETLTEPSLWVMGKRFAIGVYPVAILFKGLECTSLVRTHMFAGPLLDVDVAGFRA